MSAFENFNYKFYVEVDVNGKQNTDAAWFYPVVSELATSIKNHVAFWKGVQVVE